MTAGGTSLGVGALAFSPNDQRLAINNFNQIKIWDLAGNKEITVLRYDEFSSEFLRPFAFSPDGRWLASGSERISGGARKVTVWDLSAGKPRWTVDGHTFNVKALAFSPDGKTIATAGADDTVKVWDALTGALLITLPKKTRRASRSVRMGDNWHASGGGSGTDALVTLWDVATKRRIRDYKHSDGISSATVDAVVFTPGGETLAVAGNGDTIDFLDISTGAVRSRLRRKVDAYLLGRFQPDWQTISDCLRRLDYCFVGFIQDCRTSYASR